MKMAEAMGFELMDLLQSTVFKSDMQVPLFCGVQLIFVLIRIFFATSTGRILQGGVLGFCNTFLAILRA
ncbi:hypothetical protein ASD91_05200 [Pseudomonas sp. Root68]|nr:hypothetical protein ASD91_05200 [Pseudomonas sp. Root68]KRB66421.1 hypothetical protein ASD95_06460 [Pseudomonas sp. Root71]